MILKETTHDVLLLLKELKIVHRALNTGMTKFVTNILYSYRKINLSLEDSNDTIFVFLAYRNYCYNRIVLGSKRDFESWTRLEERIIKFAFFMTLGNTLQE